MFSKTFHFDEQPWCHDKENNVDSRIVASGAGLTMVEWTFHNKGHVVALHAHYHEQASFVLKGSCEGYLADGSKTVFHAGEAVYFGPNEEHKVVTLEPDTVILDAFTPCRLDHLAKHTEYNK